MVRAGISKKAVYSKIPWQSWAKRAEVMDRYMQTVFKDLQRRGELSSAHHFGHVQRVGYYAGEYIKQMERWNPHYHKRKQQLGVIAGLTHDRVRDKTEQFSHEQAAGKFMQEKFKKRYGQKSVKMLTEAISNHGELPPLNKVGRNIVRDAVVFADKFFEANGAYIAFRRAMFMGERKDRRDDAKKKGWDLSKPEDVRKAAVEFTLDETDKRIKAFSDLSKIPKHMHPFVKYQVEWQFKLKNGLEKREPWAVHLSETLFAEGLKERPRVLDDVIKSYEPIAKEDAEFKAEAMRYLNGQLAEKFRSLV